MDRGGLTAYLREFGHRGGIIVSESRKLIYMKPSRAAGTSITRILLKSQIPDIIHHKQNPEEFKAWLDGINDEDLEQYFIFSVARNPWDRMVSVATYYRVPLEEFLSRCVKGKDWNNPEMRLHALPMFPYSYMGDKLFVDATLRIEDLQHDLDRVCEQLGLEKVNPLPRTQDTRHDHYSKYYDGRTQDIVAQVYARDIELFDYKF